MPRIEIREERCKGCLLCTLVCPKSILAASDRFNKQGYKPAEVTDKSKCTGCGSCALICPDVCITVWKAKKAKPEETA